MKQCLAASLMLISTLAAPAALAAPLQVTYADVVKPDAELVSFLKGLTSAAQSKDYAAVDAMIAPDLKGFSRGLDPLEKWQAIDLAAQANASGLEALTSNMVEMDDLPENAPNHIDYRENLLELLVALVANPDEPLGKMPEMDKAICSPARYRFDAKAVAQFAASHNTNAYGLYLFSTDLQLRAKPEPGTLVIATIPSHTLVVTDYQDNQPETWTKVITSDGTTGWIEHHGDYQGLSQQHLCFGRIGGEYKIVGFYSYGL